MKFAIAKEHRDFFQKQGWIEFENFLSADQLAQANQAIDQVLAERLQLPLERLPQLPSESSYLQGRDVWRSNPFLSKLVKQPRFAEIASELIETKPLRLGYDQVLPAPYSFKFSPLKQQVYTHFMEQTASLEAVSCLQGVVCGLILTLKHSGEPREGSSLEGINIFPTRSGSAIFFQPTISINWSALFSCLPEERFYLIVYTQAMARYHLQPQDPHTHALKQLGYVFNDKLNDHLHPIVYR